MEITGWACEIAKTQIVKQTRVPGWYVSMIIVASAATTMMTTTRVCAWLLVSRKIFTDKYIGFHRDVKPFFVLLYLKEGDSRSIAGVEDFNLLSYKNPQFLFPQIHFYDFTIVVQIFDFEIITDHFINIFIWCDETTKISFI